jgi:hypothetical protein
MSTAKITVKEKLYTTLTAYEGVVTAFEDGRRLWSKSVGIDRIDAMDAVDDAIAFIHRDGDLIVDHYKIRA